MKPETRYLYNYCVKVGRELDFPFLEIPIYVYERVGLKSTFTVC